MKKAISTVLCWLIDLSAVSLLLFGFAGCGESGGKGSAADVRSSTADTKNIASTSGLKGDEDDDDTSEIDNRGIPFDSDNDKDNDQKVIGGSPYRDGDDGALYDYGHAASMAEREAIALLVQSYFRAVDTDQGSAVCRMLYSAVAKAVAEEPGQAPGAVHTQGDDTCAAIASRLFMHRYSRNLAAMKVTGVRVDGDRGRVLLGSNTRPASFFFVRREGGAWKLESLVASPGP